MLLPTIGNPLRRALETWFETADIAPRVVGECDDSALMKVFGQAAGCVFPAPSAIEADVRRVYRARIVGRTGVRERYYVISAERRLRHPGVVALTGAAREQLFKS